MPKKLSYGTIELDKEHWSQYSREVLKTVGEQLEETLFAGDCKNLLFNLNHVGFYEIFVPELAALKKVPQKKQKSVDAFHHSILTVVNVPNNRVLKWAALLHDIGKAHYRTTASGFFDFRGHEYNGAKLSRSILKRMKIKESGDITKLIQFHTHPLDYQRQPNWKMSTVKNFVNKYSHLSPLLVDLAIADKIASSGQSDYLEELYKLKQMVEEIQNDKR